MKDIVQFIKFGVVGLSNTIISYMIYTGTLLIMQATSVMQKYDYLVAQIVAFFLSVLWSFYWNNKYVFGQMNQTKQYLIRSLIKAYISYAFTGLFLSSMLLVWWINIVNISEFIAPIINLIITVPLNFFIQKFWTFKNEEEKDEE